MQKKEKDPCETAVEKCFNLLREKWILVMESDLSIKEVSLLDLFEHAHEYKQLAGEMETQNASILRVLIAIVISVFYRYDVNGDYVPIVKEDSEEEDAIDRWIDIWDRKQFPHEVIRKYLEEYEESFWLVHPERPFWQIPDIQCGTEYQDTKTLIGDIKESNNPATMHHFSLSAGEELRRLSFSEATRWIIHMNGYAVNIKYDKKAGGEKIQLGVGRIGQIGLVLIKGENLFETIMLNTPFLQSGEKLWGDPKPVWEREKVDRTQNRLLPSPDNMPCLYTIQSRRIGLTIENDAVIGYKAYGGEYVMSENLFCEQMTSWKKREDKKTGLFCMVPRRHISGVQAWREFGSLMNMSSSSMPPGVIKWNEILQNESVLDRKIVRTIQIVGMNYGSMSYTYDEAFYDSLTLSGELFTETGSTWREKIIDEIDKCKAVAEQAMQNVAFSIAEIVYGDSQSSKNKASSIQDYLTEQYFASVDRDFREWMIEISETTEVDEHIKKWRSISRRKASLIIDSYIARFRYRIFDTRAKGNSFPQIYNSFKKDLGDIYGRVDSNE